MGEARVTIVGPGGAVPDGVLDLGPASDESLARVAIEHHDAPAMMSFRADQLPELAVAVARGVQVVQVEDVLAATKVCRVLEAIMARA